VERTVMHDGEEKKGSWSAPPRNVFFGRMFAREFICPHWFV